MGKQQFMGPIIHFFEARSPSRHKTDFSSFFGCNDGKFSRTQMRRETNTKLLF